MKITRKNGDKTIKPRKEKILSNKNFMTIYKNLFLTFNR